MRTNLLRAAAATLMTMATPMVAACAHADSFDFSNPYADDAPRPGLHFADLEAASPTDPFLWSADPGWKPHHTPAEMLAPAHDAVRMAVPRGMPAGDARLALEQAGARCFTSAVTELDCRYRDVETPMRGSAGNPATDDVTWSVKIALVDGRASDIALARDWTRH